MRSSLENSILPLKDPNMRKEVSPKENYSFSFFYTSKEPFWCINYVLIKDNNCNLRLGTFIFLAKWYRVRISSCEENVPKQLALKTTKKCYTNAVSCFALVCSIPIKRCHSPWYISLWKWLVIQRVGFMCSRSESSQSPLLCWKVISIRYFAFTVAGFLY